MSFLKTLGSKCWISSWSHGAPWSWGRDSAADHFQIQSSTKIRGLSCCPGPWKTDFLRCHSAAQRQVHDPSFWNYLLQELWPSLRGMIEEDILKGEVQSVLQDRRAEQLVTGEKLLNCKVNRVEDAKQKDAERCWTIGRVSAWFVWFRWRKLWMFQHVNRTDSYKAFGPIFRVFPVECQDERETHPLKLLYCAFKHSISCSIPMKLNLLKANPHFSCGFKS